MAKINRNIIFLGVVSFLTDFSSEMVFPILPIFLSHFLQATKFEIGIIEGTAQFVASFLKVMSGYISDRIGRRKAIVVAGYSISTVVKPFLFFADSWRDVFLIRVFERTGKGIRTSPRDAIISHYTTSEKSGKSFGFHMAMDTFGAVFGGLFAFFVLFVFGQTEDVFRAIFLISFFPALLAVIVLMLFVKEPPVEKKISRSTGIKGRLNNDFYAFLLIHFFMSVFSMNFSFMILKANSVGVSIGVIPAVYVVFNLVYAFFSYPVGAISDRFGKGKTLSAVYLVFSITALLFTGKGFFYGLAGFIMYGVYMAGSEVISRSIVSDIVSQDLKGTAYGILHTVTGVATFISLSVAGYMWDRFGANFPFFVAFAGSLFLSMICYIKFGRKL